MACGTLKPCKQDHDGNMIGYQLDNLILDMSLYDLEFPDGEVISLTANTIAQAMYAQCNIDGNDYLLLECFVDIQEDSTAISLAEQKGVHNEKSTCGRLPLVGLMLSMERHFQS